MAKIETMTLDVNATASPAAMAVEIARIVFPYVVRVHEEGSSSGYILKDPRIVDVTISCAMDLMEAAVKRVDADSRPLFMSSVTVHDVASSIKSGRVTPVRSDQGLAGIVKAFSDGHLTVAEYADQLTDLLRYYGQSPVYSVAIAVGADVPASDARTFPAVSEEEEAAFKDVDLAQKEADVRVTLAHAKLAEMQAAEIGNRIFVEQPGPISAEKVQALRSYFKRESLCGGGVTDHGRAEAVRRVDAILKGEAE